MKLGKELINQREAKENDSTTTTTENVQMGNVTPGTEVAKSEDARSDSSEQNEEMEAEGGKLV